MLISIAGCRPHEEDEWLGGRVRVGDAVVRLHEQVARRAITTQNRTPAVPTSTRCARSGATAATRDEDGQVDRLRRVRRGREPGACASAIRSSRFRDLPAQPSTSRSPAAPGTSASRATRSRTSPTTRSRRARPTEAAASTRAPRASCTRCGSLGRDVDWPVGAGDGPGLRRRRARHRARHGRRRALPRGRARVHRQRVDRAPRTGPAARSSGRGSSDDDDVAREAIRRLWSTWTFDSKLRACIWTQEFDGTAQAVRRLRARRRRKRVRAPSGGAAAEPRAPDGAHAPYGRDAQRPRCATAARQLAAGSRRPNPSSACSGATARRESCARSPARPRSASSTRSCSRRAS